MCCRFVWLNQYADQFLPIVSLVGLRIVVGLGNKLLKVFFKPKKDPMQVMILLSRMPLSFSRTNSLAFSLNIPLQLTLI